MKIILDGNPVSTNQIYRRHGHIMYMSRQGKQMKESYQWQAKTQCRGFKCVTEAFWITIRLYFGDKRNRDIDNYNKILLDSLTGIVWEDDKQIQKMTIEKFIDLDNPRIEIEVESYGKTKSGTSTISKTNTRRPASASPRGIS